MSLSATLVIVFPSTASHCSSVRPASVPSTATQSLSGASLLRPASVRTHYILLRPAASVRTHYILLRPATPCILMYSLHPATPCVCTYSLHPATPRCVLMYSLHPAMPRCVCTYSLHPATPRYTLHLDVLTTSCYAPLRPATPCIKP